MRFLRVSVALAALVALMTLAPSARLASAAGARPDFQLPFACGTSWQPTTYSTGTDLRSGRTWSHENLLDFPGGAGGQSVYASAGGFARLVNTSEGKVQVDHGAGWSTIYQHMTGITVSTNGRNVQAGERLGVIGAGQVGTSNGPHLHYGQLADGVPTPPLFNGASFVWGPGRTYTSGNYRFVNDRTATGSIVSRNACTGGPQPVADLMFIKTNNVGSGRVEVHRVTAASGYRTGSSDVSRFSPGDRSNGWFQMSNMDGDGRPDLVFIKTNNVGSGKVEVHWLSAASGFRTQTSAITRFSPGDRSNGWFHIGTKD